MSDKKNDDSRSEKDQYYHNKGQEDASKGEYNKPHGFPFDGGGFGSLNDAKDNDRYNDGWRHTKDQSSSSSGGCFITTATLMALGKPDNCDELNTFRNFRDSWLAKQFGGQEMIAEYYKIAPGIVTAINSIANNEDIYMQLWTESIQPCLTFIKQNRFEDAKSIYCNVVANLKEKYLDK